MPSTMEAVPHSISFCRFLSLSSVNHRSHPSVPLRFQTSSPLLRIRPFLPPPSPPRSLRFNCSAHSSDHRHQHHQHSDHDHQHSHHHHHHHGHCGGELTGSQRVFLKFAQATGWAGMANFLRENLRLCCCSTGLFLVAAACPYLIPKPAVKTVQNSLMLIAFPIVGVRISLLSLHAQFITQYQYEYLSHIDDANYFILCLPYLPWGLVNIVQFL